MLQKTRGIVLHTFPYNEKFVIIHIYTEAFGRVAYLTPHGRGKKSKIPHSLFMPLSVLDLDVDHSNLRDLQRIREAKTALSLIQIPLHPVKGIIALFIAEVLYRSINNKENESKLFQFIYHSIQWLEISESGFANFHLVFLIHLVRYLGVYPNTSSYKDGSFFDMLEGVFVTFPPNHPHYLDRNESIIFTRLLRMNYENMGIYHFSRQERISIINRTLDYYRLHLSDFGEIKSLSVMQSLFD